MLRGPPVGNRGRTAVRCTTGSRQQPCHRTGARRGWRDDFPLWPGTVCQPGIGFAIAVRCGTAFTDALAAAQTALHCPASLTALCGEKDWPLARDLPPVSVRAAFRSKLGLPVDINVRACMLKHRSTTGTETGVKRPIRSGTRVAGLSDYNTFRQRARRWLHAADPHHAVSWDGTAWPINLLHQFMTDSVCYYATANRRILRCARSTTRECNATER
jgi:hypothetical protein